MAERNERKSTTVSKTSPEKIISAAKRTVENWPQWKRDTYNRSFAVAYGSKKY